MTQLVQTSGFARHNVEAFARVFKVDSRAAYMGQQINDKLIVGLREASDRLGKVSFVGARDCLLACDVKRVFIWKIKLAKDGDTYERKSEVNEVTRGSIKLLRATYGASNVMVTDESGAKKICAQKKADKGTLAFYSLSHVAKEEKKATVKKGAKIDAKSKGAKDKAKDGKVRVKVAKK